MEGEIELFRFGGIKRWDVFKVYLCFYEDGNKNK